MLKIQLPEVTVNTLDNEVKITFYAYRVLAKDFAANRLAALLIEKTEEDYGDFTNMYTDVVTYVTAMEFNWSDTTPEPIKNLETWWDMLNTETPEECYLYLANMFPLSTVAALVNAQSQAQKITKPKVELDNSGEAGADPN
jgi:hypothetical protein